MERFRLWLASWVADIWLKPGHVAGSPPALVGTCDASIR